MQAPYTLYFKDTVEDAKGDIEKCFEQVYRQLAHKKALWVRASNMVTLRKADCKRLGIADKDYFVRNFGEDQTTKRWVAALVCPAGSITVVAEDTVLKVPLEWLQQAKKSDKADFDKHLAIINANKSQKTPRSALSVTELEERVAEVRRQRKQAAKQSAKAKQGTKRKHKATESDGSDSDSDSEPLQEEEKPSPKKRRMGVSADSKTVATHRQPLSQSPPAVAQSASRKQDRQSSSHTGAGSMLNISPLPGTGRFQPDADLQTQQAPPGNSASQSQDWQGDNTGHRMFEGLLHSETDAQDRSVLLLSHEAHLCIDRSMDMADMPPSTARDMGTSENSERPPAMHEQKMNMSNASMHGQSHGPDQHKKDAQHRGQQRHFSHKAQGMYGGNSNGMSGRQTGQASSGYDQENDLIDRGL